MQIPPITIYSKRYHPDDHDIMLFNKWKRGMDDFEIRQEFLRQGLDFPHDVIRKARMRLKLKAHKIGEVINDKHGRLAAEKPDALAVAQATLPGFDRTTLAVDGTWIGLKEAMRRTNLILKAAGLAQVDYNPEWVQ